MTQLDARLRREASALGNLDLPPAVLALPQRYFGLGQNEALSLTRSTGPAAIVQPKLRRVVLVEPEQYYREVLTVELLRQGFIVHAFGDGASVLGSLATAGGADIAVLDWDSANLPSINLLTELRQRGVNLPVVFLTGKVIAGDDQDQCLLAPREVLNAHECAAFDQGAVDFISKSRDRQVLVKRLKLAIELARPATVTAVETRVTCDKLQMKPGSNRACWRQVDVGLTLGEYRIVYLLASNAGSFMTYRAIYDRLHYEGFIAGIGENGFRANVRSAMKRIRNKFRACDLAFDEIENYSGVGYCWRKPS